jgi:hypothetical protein
MIKHCSKCKCDKNIEDFSYDKSSRDGRAYWCKPCAAKNARESFAIRIKNPEYRSNKNNKAKTLMREAKDRAVEYMGSKCFDCGGVYPNYVYDFHHLEPSTKDVNPSKAFRKDFEQTKKELDKCVMLCANCHRIRHYKREHK